MRLVISVVLALSVGIGAYLGSAQAAGSATARPRMVILRIDEVAAAGRSHCRATSESRSQPYRYAYMRCWTGPEGSATYTALVGGGAVAVFKKGVDAPVYTTP
jgi:hypothetical protein